MSYVAPKLYENSFTCPHCGVLGQIIWHGVGISNNFSPLHSKPTEDWIVAYPERAMVWSGCTVCTHIHVWHGDRMIYPSGQAPPPNEDMPDDIRADYQEASSIAQLSPRGAAALLRLALQKLLASYSEKREIDKAIKDLVAQGLINRITQQAMDTLRIVGNDAVHPGEINLNEDPARVQGLFSLLNLICDQLLTMPKTVGQAYNQLPVEKRKWIEERDRQKTT